MNLKDDKQQNIQIELDFSSAPTGEAREAGREETEPSGATSGTENPASTNRLMEAVCERENLKAALRQVKANKGSPGVDGMTVGGIKDYLKQHWPAIREQLLNGTYEPRPVRRVEIPKPDGNLWSSATFAGVQEDPCVIIPLLIIPTVWLLTAKSLSYTVFPADRGAWRPRIPVPRSWYSLMYNFLTPAFDFSGQNAVGRPRL
jgi:hypothetical protein